MVTVLAVKQYDALLREYCFHCKVQVNSKVYSIKPEHKTLPCSEKVVRDYYNKIYKAYDIYYNYSNITTVYKQR